LCLCYLQKNDKTFYQKRFPKKEGLFHSKVFWKPNL
jgi:hypothetical protein